MQLTVYKRGRVYWVRGTIKEKIKGKKHSQPIRESTGSYSKSEAIRYAVELEEEIKRQFRYGKEQETYFGEAAADYIEDGGEYRYLEPILKEIANKLIIQIKPGHIKQLAKKLYPKAGPSTWNRQVITPAQAVINHAADKGICNFIRVKRFKEAKVIKKAIGREWINKFRAHAVNDYVRALVLFNYTTAARISEALALQPHHFDLVNKRAFIERTKNDEPREFILTDEVIADLKNLTPRRVKDGTFRVFGYMGKTGVYKAMKTTCKLAGIEYLATHQPGRHSFATETITRQNEPATNVAATGNWKSVDLLLKTYAHPEGQEQMVERVFGKKSENCTKDVQSQTELKVISNDNK